jgi:hypothetical protein
MSFQGKLHYDIDSWIGLFCNHGCNGTYNVGKPSCQYYTEVNVDLHHPGELIMSAPIFSPFTERHLRHFQYRDDSILRKINRGDEILCNYLAFVGVSDDFEEFVME